VRADFPFVGTTCKRTVAHGQCGLLSVFAFAPLKLRRTRFGPPASKITRLNEKIATLRQEIQRLNGLNTLMMQTEDKQISLTDPDARSMATSGRGSGMVGYNVKVPSIPGIISLLPMR
jgi:TolA-binding protein